MNNQPILYLMLGYPGAGKTTAAKVIAELTGAVRLSSDEFRLKLFPNPTFTQAEHDELYRTLDGETERLLGAGKTVIYDANLNRYRHRQDKYEICKRTGAMPKLLWLQTPRNIAKERAVHESRSHLIPPGETPAHMFERIVEVIEEPTPSEHPVPLDGTKITPEYIKAALGL